MSNGKSLWSELHKKLFEKNSLILTVGILVTVSIGGIVEIAPLFYLDSTIEEVDGMRPYTPLEQLGRDVYIREGCYNCHSQMIRPLRDEVERYGHYSLAAESMYDHPFQWGSKRTGPDLARVDERRDLVQKLGLVGHVRRLEKRPSEHELPVQGDRLGLEQHDVEPIRVVDQPETALWGDEFGDVGQVGAGVGGRKDEARRFESERLDLWGKGLPDPRHLVQRELADRVLGSL